MSSFSAVHSVRQCPVFPQFNPSGSFQFFFCSPIRPIMSSFSAVHSVRQCPVFPQFIPSGNVQFFCSSFRPAMSSFSAVYFFRKCPVFSSVQSVRQFPFLFAVHSVRQYPVFPPFNPSGNVQFSFRSSFRPTMFSFSADLFLPEMSNFFLSSIYPAVSSSFRSSFRPAMSSFSAVRSVQQCPVPPPPQCPVPPHSPPQCAAAPNLLNVFDTMFLLSY